MFFIIINILLLDLLVLLALLPRLLNFLRQPPTPADKFPIPYTNTAQTASSPSNPTHKLEHHDDHAPTNKVPHTNTAQTASSPSNSTHKLEHHVDHARELVVPVEHSPSNSTHKLEHHDDHAPTNKFPHTNTAPTASSTSDSTPKLEHHHDDHAPTDKFPHTNTAKTASSPSNSTPELENHDDDAREQVVRVEHSTNIEIPITSTPGVWEYDVFLSFRGEDTRKSFTDHLFQGLKSKGIHTFRDDEKLESGKSISPELLTAITKSRFAVVVLSQNYPTSTWCLEELAHIVECKRVRGLTVLPVFHHVEPSEVRKQTGEYGKALAKHEQDSKNRIHVEKWKKALFEIASLSGYHLEDSYESRVVEKIVRRISKTLNYTFLTANKDLVGMDSRIQKVDKHLDLKSDDIRIIGIWGMGGSGKTTMAQEIFKRSLDKFDAAAFVANVRAESEKYNLLYLQKYLYESLLLEENANIKNEDMGIIQLGGRLRSKKVLIILDDIDKLNQIEALVPKKDNEGGIYNPLLGPGSRLIITTRDHSTLKKCGVQNENIYEVEKLKDDEASKLLCRKAFKKDSAPDEYKELVNRFVKYAAGLPLAVEVVGTDLNGKNVTQWEEALVRLADDPDHEIFGVLQLSYHGLKDTDKKIFLDIACFFRGEEQHRVKRILANFYPENGIETLIGKSLLEVIEGNKLWMHDLLQQMGWHIVRGESSNDPGKRSRLWINYEDAYDELGSNNKTWLCHDARYVLTDNKGTNAVEGILLNLHANEDEIKLKADPFSKMENLRLFKIRNVKFSGWKLESLSLSKKLRLFEWHSCPLESLPSSFQLDQLVELKMPKSRIKQLSNESLLSLKELKVLDLTECESLESLPDSICNLKFLQVLKLSGCSKLKVFPEIVGNNMKTLQELHLDETAIKELPMSIHRLSGLTFLSLRDCKELLSLTSVISTLTSLKHLDLSGCSRIEQVPEELRNFQVAAA